jgi:hypothetical protein
MPTAHPPYYKGLLAFALFATSFVPTARSQTVQYQDGILIDVSGSISRGGSEGNLFHEYLRATKTLLANEPPNSRVWVSTITNNSFGGVHEIVRGWTPNVHGVFMDDLHRALRQLATDFEAKSASLIRTCAEQ